MIFIPCKGGISHRPDESIEPGDLARGVSVLARVLARLSAGPESAYDPAGLSRESVPVMEP